MNNAQNKNPLYGITIGATINSLTGKFKASVVNAPVSIMVGQEATQKYMSGTSSYVFSEKMNQGSLGLSGAYGVSGVSLLKSSLSAYVGQSAAVSSNSVAVNYNAVSVAGVEYINFEQLTASDFMSSLNKACCQSITTVLDAYNAVIAEAKASGLDLLSALSSNASQSNTLKIRIRDWVKASEQFTRDFGDGVVIGVAWGAFGGVSMVLTASSEAESWKYGGQADFSYANVFAAVAVKATYDGSQARGAADVTVNCTSYVNGSVLAPQIKEWFDRVADKSFGELAEVRILDKAPVMDISRGAPQIPDFVLPVPGEAITGKVDAIENLEALDTMAKAAAYEKELIDKPELTFDEFLDAADKPAAKEALDVYKEKILNNDIDTLDFSNAIKEDNNGKIVVDDKEFIDEIPAIEQVVINNEPAAVTTTGTEGYVPLGVWISNWADLFPWMAQGYYNSIDSISGVQAVRGRVMLQDFQTLSKMYYLAHANGITEFKRKDSSRPRATSLGLADSFVNAAAKIQEALVDIRASKIQAIYESLGEAEKSIYRKWNEIAFLRNCELGLGLVKDYKTITKPVGDQDKVRETYSLETCNFDGKNFPAFGRAYKLLPLLTPDGDIWAFGPGPGALSSIYDSEAVFSSPGRAGYLVFEYNKEERVLINSVHDVKLYPIPFSAAQSVSQWKGMSFSTNIGADKALNKDLEILSEQLERLNAWSFSSAEWDRNWNGKDAYRQKSIRKQYIGLIDEIPNIL